MNSELNLELFTIAMTRLNNGFAKLGDVIQDNAETLSSNDLSETDYDKIAVKITRILPDFDGANNEFKEFLDDIREDLNQSEINVNEYQPFFEHVDETFPAYESQLNEGIKGLKDAMNNGSEKLKKVIGQLEIIIEQINVTFTAILSLSNNFLAKVKSGEIR